MVRNYILITTQIRRISFDILNFSRSAKNAAGDSGVIPANYVTRLDQVETTETSVLEGNHQELLPETSLSSFGTSEVRFPFENFILKSIELVPVV